MTKYPRFLPMGDSAILVEYGREIDPEVNRRVQALARLLEADGRAGVGEAVAGYSTLTVHYDSMRIANKEILTWMQECVARAGEAALPEPQRVEIPVVYGGEHGPDLEFVARHAGLTPAEVVRIHAAGEYRVYMIGFTPGFPYLGGLDERIACPRLESPRSRVAAGSVGIAGSQTGIYPIDSPGGWRIIGYTPLRLFDPFTTPPCLLSAGDHVKFTISN
jgi:inhibitor of KinA